MNPEYVRMLTRELEQQIDEAMKLDADELASQILKIGFSCRMCGNCCRRAAGDNRVMLTCRDIVELERSEKCMHAPVSAMLPIDVDHDCPISLEANLDELDVDDQGRIHAFGWCLKRKDNGDCCFLGDPCEFSIPPSSSSSTPLSSSSSTSSSSSSSTSSSSSSFTPFIGGLHGPVPAAECRCVVYGNRPYLCRTYPFFIADGHLEVSECEGLGGFITGPDATILARDLIDRYVCELKETLLLYRNFHCFDVSGAGKRLLLENISRKQAIYVVHHCGGDAQLRVRLKMGESKS